MKTLVIKLGESIEDQTLPTIDLTRTLTPLEIGLRRTWATESVFWFSTSDKDDVGIKLYDVSQLSGNVHVKTFQNAEFDVCVVFYNQIVSFDSSVTDNTFVKNAAIESSVINAKNDGIPVPDTHLYMLDKDVTIPQDAKTLAVRINLNSGKTMDDIVVKVSK